MDAWKSLGRIFPIFREPSVEVMPVVLWCIESGAASLGDRTEPRTHTYTRLFPSPPRPPYASGIAPLKDNQVTWGIFSGKLDQKDIDQNQVGCRP